MLTTPRQARWKHAFTLVTLGATLTTACARPRPSTAMHGSPREDHCWWAVLRSSRPADSVAARFVRAYIDAGFNAVDFKRKADTTWVTAAPTDFASQRARIASRAVAYWHGDSTHFRYFVSVTQLDHGPDSLDKSRILLDMCARVARAAAIGWSAPKSPTGEESLDVWKRR